jgi:hypothetical protein
LEAGRRPRRETAPLSPPPPRICRLLAEIKDILRTLVPERDLQSIDDTLDLPLLLQQISHSSLDYHRLAAWMSAVLKAHCAPMRDAWVDDMEQQFRLAARTDDQQILVDGIRSLFGILEAMKLVSILIPCFCLFQLRSENEIADWLASWALCQDVANHQIRHLRALLVEDTVNFEQHLYLRRIETGRLDVEYAQRWYANAARAWEQQPEASRISIDCTPVAVLVSALTESLGSTYLGDLPDTFEFDLDRLHGLRSDLHGTIALEVCTKVFELFMLQSLDGRGEEDQTPPPPPPPPPPPVLMKLRSALIHLLEDAGSVQAWAQQADKLALEMARHACCSAAAATVAGHNPKGSSSSSSSLPVPLTLPDASVVRSLTERLRRCLRSDCVLWRFYEGLALRFVTGEALQHTLSLLDQSLLAAADLAMAQACEAVERSTSSSSSPSSTSSFSSPPSFNGMLTDIARRLAHVASLHWRVFEPLVYRRAAADHTCSTERDSEDNDSHDPTTTTTTTTTVSDAGHDK